MQYQKHYSTKVTPQDQPIPGSNQVANSAGGYSFQLDDWKRLDRFLILGSQGGTYYINEQKLTVENADAVKRCIDTDGIRVVQKVVEISDSGRAPKNDPALFVLAMCAGLGNKETRKAALEALPKVARIGTHLFHFAQYVEAFRGWGRGLREGIASWYLSKPVNKLAYDVVKYQSRDGWSHRDLLRLAHPKTKNVDYNTVFSWVVNGDFSKVGSENVVPNSIYAFEEAKKAETVQEVVNLIRRENLPREAIPTKWLNEKTVWEALLEDMPMTALIRNLGNLSKNGVLTKGNWDAVNHVTSTVTDEEKLRKARVHPIAILSALKTYASGHGVRGKGEWEVVPNVVDALDDAFYKAFKFVEPTGKRIVLTLDVSGSMTSGEIAGVPGLTPRVGAAAMAMVTHKTEVNSTIVAFASSGVSSKGYSVLSYYNRGMNQNNPDDGMVSLDISRRQRLDDIVSATTGLPFGGTDCALPMLWAMKHNVQADAFVIYTDSETWAGNIHPVQALKQYRQKFVSDAKLVVVGMTSNGFTIADPNDSGMLDVVGFDAITPSVLNEFVAGEI